MENERVLKATIIVPVIITLFITGGFGLMSLIFTTVGFLPPQVLLINNVPIVLGILLISGSANEAIVVDLHTIRVEKSSKVTSEVLRIEDIVKVSSESEDRSVGAGDMNTRVHYTLNIEDKDGGEIKLNRVQYRPSDIRWLRDYLIEKNPSIEVT